MTRELRLGIFVGTAILILAVFIFIVGDMSVLFKASDTRSRLISRQRQAWINGLR